MQRFFRLAAIFFGAALVTHVIASVLVTQHVLANVADMGLAVPAGTRVSSTWHDILGLLPSYLPLIALGMLIGFLVAAFLARRVPGLRLALFVLAGFVALITVNIALRAAFDITPVAPARTLGGLLAQGAAGAAGGLLFAMLARPGRA